MSYCPTALTALEHDTARRLEPRESSSPSTHDRRHDERLIHHALDHGPFNPPSLDRGRLLLERAIALAAAATPGDVRETPGEDADSRAPAGAPRDPAREALERTCLTVKRIAHDIGMPRATLEAYRLGTRRMPHTARVRLGTYLAAHAAMLDDLAQALIAPAADA